MPAARRKPRRDESDTSPRFYEALRKKIFEALGSKVCAGCGFKDQRALGFASKYGDMPFDEISRGGAASSWTKYAAEPELARSELSILCLNCNRIREPIVRPSEDKRWHQKRRKKQRDKPFPR